MNLACRHKDCSFRPVCMAMIDLVECSKYRTGVKLPEILKGVGPVDRQKRLFDIGSLAQDGNP